MGLCIAHACICMSICVCVHCLRQSDVTNREGKWDLRSTCMYGSERKKTHLPKAFSNKVKIRSLSWCVFYSFFAISGWLCTKTLGWLFLFWIKWTSKQKLSCYALLFFHSIVVFNLDSHYDNNQNLWPKSADYQSLNYVQHYDLSYYQKLTIH